MTKDILFGHLDDLNIIFITRQAVQKGAVLVVQPLPVRPLLRRRVNAVQRMIGKRPKRPAVVGKNILTELFPAAYSDPCSLLAYLVLPHLVIGRIFWDETPQHVRIEGSLKIGSLLSSDIT